MAKYLQMYHKLLNWKYTFENWYKIYHVREIESSDDIVIQISKVKMLKTYDQNGRFYSKDGEINLYAVLGELAIF